MQFATRLSPLVARCVLAILVLGLIAMPMNGFAQNATPEAAEPPVASPEAGEPPVVVDCSAGGSLSEALAEHEGATTYLVLGTCMEQVTITHDDITIDGGGSAVIDAGDAPEGPVVHVLGARNVVLKGIAVQNGNQGILVENLSTVTLDNVEPRNNDSHGVEIIQSHATATGLWSHDNGRVGLILNRSSEVRVIDSTLESNGISGMVIFSTAIGRLEGTNVVRDNAAQGVTLGLGGMIFTIGAELLIENNGAQGLLLQQDGAAQFLGGTLTVRGNGGDGIGAELGSTLVLGEDDFGVQGQVLIEENDGHGLSVWGSAELANDAIMPLTVRANAGSGVYVDAGLIYVVGATIENNEGPAIELLFGARATFEDVMVDEVVCGEGVLVRGSVGCP